MNEHAPSSGVARHAGPARVSRSRRADSRARRSIGEQLRRIRERPAAQSSRRDRIRLPRDLRRRRRDRCGRDARHRQPLGRRQRQRCRARVCRRRARVSRRVRGSAAGCRRHPVRLRRVCAALARVDRPCAAVARSAAQPQAHARRTGAKAPGCSAPGDGRRHRLAGRCTVRLHHGSPVAGRRRAPAGADSPQDRAGQIWIWDDAGAVGVRRLDRCAPGRRAHCPGVHGTVGPRARLRDGAGGRAVAGAAGPGPPESCS